MPDTKKYLTRAEAADYLSSAGFPTAKSSLQKFAVHGGGPVYRVFGRNALYTRADLDAWVEGRISQPRRSTSDVSAAA